MNGGMNMFYIFITLIVVAIALFISSYFLSDKMDQLEEQFEQFSISSMQDTYQMKKKIKILEEELLTEDITMAADQVAATESIPSVIEDKPLLIQKIYHLRSEEHTSELKSRNHLVCRLLIAKKHTN